MTAVRDKVLGSLYAMAAGDALGVPTSFLTPWQIEKTFGWVDTFLPPEKGHVFHDGLLAGEYTDDTEQALALAHSFARLGYVDPRDVVEEIIKWADRVKDKYASPLGPSTEKALRAIRAGGDITQSGRYGNTNGSAMRISPLGILHGLRGSSLEELARDVHKTCLPTHNTKVCNATACAIAWGVAVCIRGESDLQKIVEETIRAAEVGNAYGYDFPAPGIPRRIRMACDAVIGFDDPKKALAELYDLLGGGDLAADSVASAIALFLLGKGDPKKVCEYAVNLGGDCDTNAAMAGAMAGAYSGISAVPEAWIQTIDTVNDADLNAECDSLMETARRWKVAE